MKVILVNGSSRKNGNTDAALTRVAEALNENGIETETFFIGNGALTDCMACGKCREIGRCVIDDSVNGFVKDAGQADGFVFGSPVYYAHPSGRLLSFLDRVFFSGAAAFRFKPGAAVLTARRAGCTASLDVINKYFTISGMPVVSSTYWNMAFGTFEGDISRDEEGVMIMRNIGKNMAWLLKCIAAGKESGVEYPANDKTFTNFIR